LPGAATSSNLQHLVIPFARARFAKRLSVAHNLAAKVNAFSALGADYALAFVSGELFFGEFDFYPLLGE
jgi:hypothetical protein